VLYLLVGNFHQGFQCLLQRKSVTPAENNALLSEVGLLAVGPQEEKIALPAAQGLVEHAMVLCLVLLALFTLVSWL
jgi:AmpE protein